MRAETPGTRAGSDGLQLRACRDSWVYVTIMHAGKWRVVRILHVKFVSDMENGIPSQEDSDSWVNAAITHILSNNAHLPPSSLLPPRRAPHLMNQYVTPHNNCCPHCGNQLAVKISSGGQMPNSPYIRASPSLPVPASQFTVPLTGANVVNPSAALKLRCKSQKPCGSGRIDAACSRNMCQRHCIEIGDCALRPHQRKHDQMLGAPTPTPRARKSQPAPPAPLRLPFTDYDSHDDWTSKALPGIRALDNYTPPIDPMRAQQLRHVDALAAMAGIKSPSPDSVEDEDAQLALGICMSLAQFNSSGTGPSCLASPPRAALHLPSTILQAGHRSPPFYQTQCSPSASFSQNQDDYPVNYPPPARLRSLSSSPIFPSSIPLPTSESQIKLKPKKAAGKKAALLTIQLNNDWMSLGLQSSETPPTLHVKKKATCSFIVVFWHTAGEEHKAFLINNVPSWPVWQVSEATGSLASRLGDGAVLDLLHPKFKKWVDMDLDHVHQLTPDCVVMFRRHGLDCINFEDTKDSFYPPNVNIHIHDNLPGERATLRRLYSIKHRLPEAPRTPGSAAEDSDIEIVGEKRTRVKQENFEDLLAPHCQRLHLRIDTDKCIVIDDDIDTPALMTASSLPSSVPSSLAPSPTFSSVPLPSLSSTSPTISWPTGEFVIDMIAGFKRMECQDFKGLACHNRFERAFKWPYITSTVSKQKAIYAAATEEEVQKGVDACRSKDGLWSIWRKKHGLAACIAARRGHAA
ncbi:hypothetical protein B0H14DRAFT_3466773 [Mycena olivaceomarginata]|nr:hypothetical protein B0H14DRAFT_3466773 [Mycena olivaceomarginata]